MESLAESVLMVCPEKRVLLEMLDLMVLWDCLVNPDCLVDEDTKETMDITDLMANQVKLERLERMDKRAYLVCEVNLEIEDWMHRQTIVREHAVIQECQASMANQVKRVNEVIKELQAEKVNPAYQEDPHTDRLATEACQEIKACAARTESAARMAYQAFPECQVVLARQASLALLAYLVRRASAAKMA